MKGKKAIDDAMAFEAALAAQPKSERYLLRLFIAGSTPRSALAIQNIRALCEDQLRDRYDLEVIDICQHPELTRPEQIVVAPTLVKKLPLPFRKIIGDLSDRERVLVGLDIVPSLPPAVPPERGHGS